jgi:predicted protein tyrosine phosphatase
VNQALNTATLHIPDEYGFMDDLLIQRLAAAIRPRIALG